MKILSCVIVAALLGTSAACRRTESTGPAQTDPGIAIAAPNRPVYPYSVIRGGVASGQELAKALGRDAVAGRHYRDVEPRTLYPARLDQDEFVHVSYRYQNKIYWTTKRLRIPAGETVLTANGRPAVRARCGNRISFQPVSPTLPPQVEPSAENLNPPEIGGKPYSEWVHDSPLIPFRPPEPAVAMAPFVPEEKHSEPEPWYFPPPYPLILPSAHSTAGRTMHTPEPDTFFLVGAAVVVLVGWKLRRRA